MLILYLSDFINYVSFTLGVIITYLSALIDIGYMTFRFFFAKIWDNCHSIIYDKYCRYRNSGGFSKPFSDR